jgi:hypothetical protein
VVFSPVCCIKISKSKSKQTAVKGTELLLGAIFLIFFCIDCCAAQELDLAKSRKWRIKGKDDDNVTILDRNTPIKLKKKPCSLCFYDSQQKVLSLILCGLRKTMPQDICHRVALFYSHRELRRAHTIIDMVKFHNRSAKVTARTFIWLQYCFLPRTTSWDIFTAIDFVCKYYYKKTNIPFITSEKCGEIDRIPVFIKKILFASRNGRRRDVVGICDEMNKPVVPRQYYCFLGEEGVIVESFISEHLIKDKRDDEGFCLIV